MSPISFIEVLEEQGLLAPEVTAELRKSVADSKGRISVESLAKILVDSGQLTRFQATKLIAQLRETTKESKPGQAGDDRQRTSSNNDDLLVAEEGTGLAKDKKPPKAKILRVKSDAEFFDGEAIDQVVNPLASEAKAIGDKELKAEQPFVMQAELVDEVSDAETIEVNDSIDDDSPTSTYVKPAKIAGTTSNQWDSFRIWGVGFVLAVLLVLLSWLTFWLTSGNAAQSYALAQQAYETRDYEVASQRFTAFASRYPTDGRASAAKVTAVISQIRQANDQLGDPVKAIETAASALLSVVNEPGLGDIGVRSDLASALVVVGEKMVQRADAAKTTEERKQAIAKLDSHLVLMRNPQYIPNAERITNESRIKAIEEERARILRDVGRAEDLVFAVAAMKEALEKSDVDAAYNARRTVTKKYPQLETDPQLNELMTSATELQRKAVKSTSVNPRTVQSNETKSLGRSLLLYKRSIPARKNSSQIDSIAEDAVIFIKAKRSIYAMKAADGQVLWRRYVGLENVSEPIRTPTDSPPDCFIVFPERNVLAKLSGVDGSSLWELDLAGEILHPAVDGSTIFVATADGRVFAIDSDTGQTKWAKQIPQKIAVGVGNATNKSPRYVIGEHSNLYLLNRADGACQEVYYLGHSPGTIAVPPVSTLGQLFVFHNHSAGSSRIHIFKTKEDGTGIERSQEPIELKGHVVVPPSLDGRRLVVMTDLGVTIAYDVEPASSKDKLNRVAGLFETEVSPRVAWPLVSGNDLWVAANRFSKYQIQVVGQKLVPEWVIHDEDRFIGRAIKIDDYIFHSRIVRGTEGIRVGCTSTKTGETFWETDLGVPLISIQALPSKSLAAINSQAALFQIDAAALGSGKPLSEKENPGRNQKGMLFRDPTILAGGRLAFLNAKQGTQVAIFDPKSTNTHLLVNLLQITSGKPSGEACATKEGLVIPLDNGQLVHVEPSSGKQLSPPFQPSLTVDQKTEWLPPVVLSDLQTAIGATNQKTLYHLSLGKQIKVLSERDTDLPWIKRLAVNGDLVAGIGRGSAQDQIEFIQAADLAPVAKLSIDGRVDWGPYAIDELFLVYSDTAGLLAFDRGGKQLWKLGLETLALVGPPSKDGDDILLTASNGKFFRVTAATGALVASLDLGEPMAGPPSIFGSVLLFPGAEGVLLAVPTSKTKIPSGEVQP